MWFSEKPDVVSEKTQSTAKKPLALYLLFSVPDRVCCLRVAGNQSGAAGARSGKCALSVRDRGTNTGKLYEHARKNVKEITELSVVFVCYQQEIAKRRKGMKGS